MRYLVAAMLALAPGAALAQSAADQADFKSQLEASRAPIFIDSKTVPSITATYSVRSEGCTSFVDIMLPNLTFEGTAHSSSVISEKIPWSTVTAIELWQNYVVVHEPTLIENGKRYLFAGTAAGAQRMKATADRLSTACHPRKGPKWLGQQRTN